RDSTPERNHFEKLAHFRWRQELLRLRGKRRVSPDGFRRCFAQELRDAEVHQKLRLVRVTEDAQAGIDPGSRDRRKVHVRGDVLQTGQHEWIVVRVMPVMTHERPATALRMIVLASGKAIVDEQKNA